MLCTGRVSCTCWLPMAHSTSFLPGVRTTIPHDGLAGLRENWRQDALAGLVTFLVSLPLSMGIALAAGAPAISGAIALLVGGVVVALFNGSFVTVNAPAPGLIVVMYQIMLSLGSGDAAAGYPQALAVTVIAGGILLLASTVNAGRIARIFPASTVEGMMGAVGILVVVKEVHSALGVVPNAISPLQLIAAIPSSIANANTSLAWIGGCCLVAMVLPRLVPWKWAKRIPAPILAVGMGIGLGTTVIDVPDEWRVHLPDRFWESFVFPDFSSVFTQAFGTALVTLTLIQGMETLLSAAAVDRLDPYRRRSNLNRDMAAVGAGSALSGMLGGQPLIASLLASATNVQAGARTRWANFFQGLIALAAVAFIPFAITLLPRAALSAMLIVIGASLAHPKYFRKFYNEGWHQLTIYLITFVVCIATDLLIGVLVGLVMHLVLHLVRGASIRSLFVPILDIEPEPDGDTVYVHFRHSAALSNETALRRRLLAIPEGKFVIVDFTDANLRDDSVIEQVRAFGEEYTTTGGVFDYVGLPGDATEHVATREPLEEAVEVATHPVPSDASSYHRRELSRLAVTLGADFLPTRYAAHARLLGYPHFNRKRVKYAENTLQGLLPCDMDGQRYTVKDLTVFEYEGIAAQEYKITIWLADELPYRIPVFSLRSESLLTRLYDYIGFADINFSEYPLFSARFELVGKDAPAIRRFFRHDILEYLERQALSFHVESNGRGLLLFIEERLLNPDEIRALHNVGCGLLQLILDTPPQPAEPAAVS